MELKPFFDWESAKHMVIECETRSLQHVHRVKQITVNHIFKNCTLYKEAKLKFNLHSLKLLWSQGQTPNSFKQFILFYILLYVNKMLFNVLDFYKNMFKLMALAT